MAVPLRPVAARPGPVPVISTYREHQAAPAVARAVVCTWQGLPGWHRRIRLLPDGCLDLVWDGRHARFARPADRQVRRPVGDSALVIGIRIRPGWAAVVTGTPVRHLPEVADVADVWDSTAARQVAAALAAGDSAAGCRAVLTNAVATRLASSGGPDPRVLAAVSVLRNPHANVGAAARHAGLSSRQLRPLRRAHRPAAQDPAQHPAIPATPRLAGGMRAEPGHAGSRRGGLRLFRPGPPVPRLRTAGRHDPRYLPGRVGKPSTDQQHRPHRRSRVPR